MSTTDSQPDGGAVLYHRVLEHESVTEAANDIWNVIRMSYEKRNPDERTLILDIDGHRNSEGGFESPMYLFIKQVCVGILPAFVDEIKTPITRIESSSVTFNDVIEADAQQVEEDDGEEMIGITSDGTDTETVFDLIKNLSADEVIKHFDLHAEYIDEGLYWGFQPRDE